MKSRLTKKEIEKLQLDRFRELFVEFPNGEIEHTEEPDFIVHSNIGRIGIELTDLYWEATEGAVPLQAEESIRNRIVERARELYTKRQLPPVDVSVYFSSNYTFQKRMVEQLAEKIAALVQENIPAPGDIYEETDDGLNRERFPVEIDQVTIYRITEMRHAFFSSPNAGSFPDLGPKDILRVLDNKNKKYSAYQKQCEVAWLVINMNEAKISSTFDVPQETISMKYETPFERVFLLTQFDKTFYELSVNKSKA